MINIEKYNSVEDAAETFKEKVDDDDMFENSQYEDDDQSDGPKFFPVYHSLENKEFADYDEKETSDSIVGFYDDVDDEPEVSPGVIKIKAPEESLPPTIAKTVGKVIF